MPQWLTRVSRPPREQIAPTCASVLQAIYMRKWMNERLKRRKKTGDGSPKEASKAPAQEPLQPRFYDNEQAAAPAVPSAAPIKVPADVRDEAPVAPSQHQESRRRSRPEPESASESASQSTAASEAASPGQWNRDRECRAVVGVAAVAEIVRERQVRPLSQLSPERYPQ